MRMRSINRKAPLRLAGLYALQGRYREADQLIQEPAENIADGNLEAHAEINAVRGKISFHKGEFKQAREALQRALESTENEALRIAVSPVYSKVPVELGPAREAPGLTRSMLPLAPDNTELPVAQAFALALGKDIEQALKMTRKAHEKSSGSDHDVLVAKGDIYTMDKRWDEALAAYKIASDLVPTNTGPLRKSVAILGGTEPDSKKLAGARAALERAARLEEQLSKIGVP